MLIGGSGADRLYGQDDEDLLVGGSTVHDGDAAALAQIVMVWSSGGSFAARTAALEEELGASSMLDDNVRDQVWGGSSRDWFLDFGPADVIRDLSGASDRRSR